MQIKVLESAMEKLILNLESLKKVKLEPSFRKAEK